MQPPHNPAAQKVKSTPNLKAVFMWPRGHAKSTHFDVFMPLWLMFQEKRLINFMVVVGKSEDSATRLLGDIQAELEYNARIIADFGKQQGSALWQEGEFKAAITFYMEANFMQDIILDEFTTEGNIRGYQLPIMPDKRKKPDKVQRIEAVSPLWERGFVWYNEALKDNPDMQVGIEQTLALERGSRVHDDAPDADEGAIWHLQRNTRQETFKPMFGARPTSKNTW